MGLVASTPLFEDHLEEVGEADVLLPTYSCYKLLDVPRLLLVQGPQQPGASNHQHPTSPLRAPILTESSCDEDEEVDSLGEHSNEELNKPLETQQQQHQLETTTRSVGDRLANMEETIPPSQKQRQPRMFDLYETDSTLCLPISDDEDDTGEEDAASSASRTLPFRRCKRRHCSCCCNTAMCTTSRRQRTSSSQHEQQLLQQDEETDQNLLGLSILPMLSTNISDVTEYSNSSSSIHQRTHQVRGGPDMLQKSNHSATTKPPRLPASPKHRRPLLQQLPKVPQQDSILRCNSSVVVNNNTKVAPHRGRARSEDFVEEGNIFPSAAEAPATTLLPPRNRVRSRSENFVKEGLCSMSPTNSTPNQPPMEDRPRTSEHRLRARSEDFVDFPGQNAPLRRRNRASSTPLDGALAAQGLPLMDSASASSSTKTAPSAKQAAVVLPKSPTSVLHHHFPVTAPLNTPSKTPVLPSTSSGSDSSSVSHAESLVSQGSYTQGRNEYRRLLSTMPNLSTQMKADLYHRIAWTHYQESRYQAALCVVKHALELLQLAHGCLTLEDLRHALLANKSIKGSTSTSTSQIADLILTQAKVHASLDAWHESKRLAKMALKMLMDNKRNDDATAQIIFGKGLLVLGKVYATAADNKSSVDNHKDSQQAMQHYHQALQIFSYYYQHLYVAETIHLMGEASPSNFTNPSYSQALMIRYSQHQDCQQSRPQDDIATTLARLGWNALVQGQLEFALDLSRQALERTSNPRNVASIQYQMGLIYSKLGNSTEALRRWKKTLKIQRSIFASENHVDTARTCEVIAMEYQRLKRWDRAQEFLQGSADIYSKPEDLARIQARLAHHFVVYQQDATKAKKAWNKASRIYKREQVALDEVGRCAKKAVSVLRKKQPSPVLS